MEGTASAIPLEPQHSFECTGRRFGNDSDGWRTMGSVVETATLSSSKPPHLFDEETTSFGLYVMLTGLCPDIIAC